MHRTKLLIAALAAVLISSAGGCSLVIPEVAQKPVIRNPFPQLSRVAVAPFFNLSDEPTVDGREVAMAYFAELQATPGFEVVPVGVVEEAIIDHQVNLNGPGEARRLAQILGVDAVAIGAVTDIYEYYPPRLGLRVEWYTANPGFHEIPAGYGLPWGTPEEEFIPDSLVYESQMSLAKSQMAALTPDCDAGCEVLPAPPGGSAGLGNVAPGGTAPARTAIPPGIPPQDDAPFDSPADEAFDASPESSTSLRADPQFEQAQFAEELPPAGGAAAAAPSAAGDVDGPILGTTRPTVAGVEVGASRAVPARDCRPACLPHNGPVLSHTRIYSGTDGDVVDALKGYVSFREDDRFGGWKSYLERSDDFIRFCCRMHISEMLSARGGSRKTQVVWRWPESR